jgi:hypothetical protein
VFEEDSDARRERIAIEALLKDAVRKSVRVETEREGMTLYYTSLCSMHRSRYILGLIIQNAMYGAAELDDIAENIWLDVTTPMQALVHNSQLHIPGGDTKVMDEPLRYPVLC